MMQNLYRLTTPRQAPQPVRSYANRGNAPLNPWLLWRPVTPRESQVLSVAELADCTCPELCNRDHANE